eukprot:CAMPEP_0113533778 /NCGR_PEP_ID=MMETSP0015_2-20120614/4798_1 /TAXON_ID=2838 /ORGANISM="Odontella" /LENGTH=59 /DNA_ID=CAMNT_0000432877 /DNA_START=82 /DNA_END=261 /DNA_ORIENTATION=- /assembly_acc=CAM_ASM_000160
MSNALSETSKKGPLPISSVNAQGRRRETDKKPPTAADRSAESWIKSTSTNDQADSASSL